LATLGLTISDVHRNAIEPSVKCAVPPKIFHIAKGADKDFLSGIPGVIAVTQAPQAKIVNLILVLSHKRIEGSSFTGATTAEEMLFGHFNTCGYHEETMRKT
jgi:hypothetical protein